jgi:molecular chaperone GrpE
MIFRRRRDDGAEPYPGPYETLVDGAVEGPVGYDYERYDAISAERGPAERGLAEQGIGDGYIAYAGVAPQLAELDRLRTERRALIELCLYARDRMAGAAAERIDAGLAGIGVDPLRPDGQPFDPGQHEAAASVPTDDPARHGLVAETEVPGYADRGAVVRPPVVTVYRQDAR